ncbi:MAG: GNAT family N-acetyltransferase [Holophagales bacterium]|nr:GNAT family N-acetyltransferase [Holophagales bacterium]
MTPLPEPTSPELTAADPTSAVVATAERLRLHRFRPRHLDALSELLGDPEVMRYSVTGRQDRAAARRWLEKAIRSYARTGWGHWAVEAIAGDGATGDDAGETLGFCGLKGFDVEGTYEVEVGYRLRRRFWGRGYATEAARAARDAAFTVFDLPRVISLIEPENTASIRVAEKVGMAFEKQVRMFDRPIRVYGLDRDALDGDALDGDALDGD